MDFLEDLYFGRINPNEQYRIAAAKHKKVVAKITESESALLEELSEKGKQTFYEFTEANDIISAASSLEYFKIGFRLAVQMMCDCFSENENDIFKKVNLTEV